MGGVYVLTSHFNFKTCVNVPHVNKRLLILGGIYTDIPPPVATPLIVSTDGWNNVIMSTLKFIDYNVAMIFILIIIIIIIIIMNWLIVL